MRVEGERRDGTGQPDMSLQRKVKAYINRGRPKVMTNAPGLVTTVSEMEYTPNWSVLTVQRIRSHGSLATCAGLLWRALF